MGLQEYNEAKFELLLEAGEKAGLDLSDAIDALRDRIAQCDYSEYPESIMTDAMERINKNLEGLKHSGFDATLFCFNCIISTGCSYCPYSEEMKCFTDNSPYKQLEELITKGQFEFLIEHLGVDHVYDTLKGAI